MVKYFLPLNETENQKSGLNILYIHVFPDAHDIQIIARNASHGPLHLFSL